jgi:hypothetical protein
MKPRELQQQGRELFEQLLRDRPASGGRVLTTIRPVDQMLVDHRFSERTAQLLSVCQASATGQAARQECFVCCHPWTPERVVESVGAAEFVAGADTEAMFTLMFAICWDCCWDRPAVLAALKRDFGDFAEVSDPRGRPSHEPDQHAYPAAVARDPRAIG